MTTTTKLSTSLGRAFLDTIDFSPTNPDKPNDDDDHKLDIMLAEFNEESSGPEDSDDRYTAIQVGSVLDAFKKFEGFLERRFDYLARLHWAFDNQTQAGPGRADSFDIIRDLLFAKHDRIPMHAPVSIPDLFRLETYEWIHCDGNTTSVMQRNIAQAIALGADYDKKTYVSRVLPRNLHRLEEVAKKVVEPKWPEEWLGPIDQAKAARGAKLYEQHCLSCHQGEKLFDLDIIGTDPMRVKFFDTKVGDRPYAEVLAEVSQKAVAKAFEVNNVSEEEQKAMTVPNPEWRSTGKYLTRSLHAIWASAPYLHNGSVPTLYDLLQAPSDRPKAFPVGHRQFDPEKVGYTTDPEHSKWTFDCSIIGNSNAGHEFGTNLSEEEKYDLIEHLKTL